MGSGGHLRKLISVTCVEEAQVSTLHGERGRINTRADGCGSLLRLWMGTCAVK